MRPTVGRTVLASLALGGACLASTTPTWVLAAASTPAGEVALAVGGGEVAPGVVAGGLVVMAAGGALSLAGRIARPVALVVLLAGGALVVLAALGGLGAAQAAALAQAQAQTGVAVLAGPPRTTAAPWVAVALGLAVLGLGVVAGVASRSWAPPGLRHSRPRESDAADDPWLDPDGDVGRLA